MFKRLVLVVVFLTVFATAGIVFTHTAEARRHWGRPYLARYYGPRVYYRDYVPYRTYYRSYYVPRFYDPYYSYYGYPGYYYYGPRSGVSVSFGF